MEPHRSPNQLLFGELSKKRPQHSTKKRWRDLVTSDVQCIGAGDRWYDLAQDNGEWRALYSSVPATGKGDQAEGGACAANSSNGNRAPNHQCPYGRSFRRQSDLTRHSRFCDGIGPDNPARAEEPETFASPCGKSFGHRGDRTTAIVLQRLSRDPSFPVMMSRALRAQGHRYHPRMGSFKASRCVCLSVCWCVRSCVRVSVRARECVRTCV